MEGHGLDHRVSEPSASAPAPASSVPIERRLDVLESAYLSIIQALFSMTVALDALATAQRLIHEEVQAQGVSAPAAPESVH
jgi:hypothetical protein